MTVLDRLAEHIAEMKAGQISKSTVHRLMALLRELLEARSEQDKYPLLRMFCDWSLHTKLDRRSKAGNELLDILDAMWAKSKTVDEQFSVLLEGISPARLQSEIASVLAASCIDPSLVHSSRFPMIVRHIIAGLIGKTVSRSPNAIQTKTAERLAKGYRHIADRFYFEREGEKYFFVLAAKQIEPASGGEVRIRVPWAI
jgi:hypothetical protein